MKPKKITVRVVPSTQAKNNFGNLIKRAYENDEYQIIARDGLPIAAVISISELERLAPHSLESFRGGSAMAKQQRSARWLNAVLDQIQAGGEQFSEEEVEADAIKALREVRYGKKKK